MFYQLGCLLSSSNHSGSQSPSSDSGERSSVNILGENLPSWWWQWQHHEKWWSHREAVWESQPLALSPQASSLFTDFSLHIFTWNLIFTITVEWFNTLLAFFKYFLCLDVLFPANWLHTFNIWFEPNIKMLVQETSIFRKHDFNHLPYIMWHAVVVKC